MVARMNGDRLVKRENLSRRRALKLALAGTAAATFPLPALAATRTVKFTLAWLAQGTSTFPFVGKEKGLFSKRGIDLQISRGYGSLPAAQAIASGQFDYGLVISAPLVLMVAKGLPLKGLATIDYDAMMGVGVLDGGSIKKPADLIGKKMATVPASAESPFFAAYAQRIGIDPKLVSIIDVDPKLAERTLSSGQVDAMTGVASSSLPVLLSQHHDARWMLYSSAGMPTYGTDIVSSQSVLDADKGLAAAMVDAVLESVAFTLTQPDESADIFFKAVPEAGLTANARDFIRIGMGLHRYAVAKPPAMEHGLGWGDPKVYEAMTDLVMTYLSTPGMKRPPVESWYSNAYAGNIKLTSKQWSDVTKGVGEYRKYLS
jgi:ABC-type nitrate/sulfonate/bicarbonate transport system substrate-binding protein